MSDGSRGDVRDVGAARFAPVDLAPLVLGAQAGATAGMTDGRPSSVRCYWGVPFRLVLDGETPRSLPMAPARPSR